MAQHSTRLLSSHPEAYSRSFKCFLASMLVKNAALKCIEGHVVPLINKGISELLESHDLPFRVLSVGSGEGEYDISILKALTNKIHREEGDKVSIFNRVIEPDIARLATFRTKAENLTEDFENRTNIDFEWIPMTFEEYTSNKTANGATFDVVHFIHSIYYVGVKDALVHCYEKELGEKGMITSRISLAEDQDNPMCCLAKLPDLGRHVGWYPRNGDVIAVVIEQGWKYFTCPGDSIKLDITSIFHSSSPEGNYLLDFLTHIVDFRQNEEKETVDKIINFWKEQSFINKHGKRIVELKDNAVIIVKGLS